MFQFSDAELKELEVTDCDLQPGRQNGAAASNIANGRQPTQRFIALSLPDLSAEISA